MIENELFVLGTRKVGNRKIINLFRCEGGLKGGLINFVTNFVLPDVVKVQRHF